MNFRDIFIHLRFPFSLFLMPVYWFAVSQLPSYDTQKALLVFVLWHIFIYPASNAYNSYFDKDEGSIGGIEKPPKVDIKLFYVSLLFDAVAYLLAFLLLPPSFGFALILYSTISKAYSHPAVRLKKYPIASWLIVGIFQGAFVYFSTTYVLQNETFLIHQWLPAGISTLVLWAVYPLTQVYQHEEDTQRGDNTMSILLGIRGSFLFAFLFFGIGFVAYFFYLSSQDFIYLLIFTAPSSGYLMYWFSKVLKNPAEASFQHTMRFNLISSFSMSAFYLFLAFGK
jgi:4-hydroxybenzoate polyprenyltransferase